MDGDLQILMWNYINIPLKKITNFKISHLLHARVRLIEKTYTCIHGLTSIGTTDLQNNKSSGPSWHVKKHFFYLNCWKHFRDKSHFWSSGTKSENRMDVWYGCPMRPKIYIFSKQQVYWWFRTKVIKKLNG